MGKRTEPVKFDYRLKEALDATGLPWELKHGSKHFKLVMAGRMVGIIPQGVKGDNSRIMVQKNIKNVQRIAAEIKGQGK